MSVERIHTLVVGAGQAGIAMSEHLSNLDVPHLVLEKSRIAEAWRSGRWDSLVANGPAWHDRFPTLEFDGFDQDSFVPKEEVVAYFEKYADMIAAPIRTGVEVQSAKKNVGCSGFVVATSEGTFEAENIVAATGAFQNPVVPPLIPKTEPLFQLHSFHYRNPEQLPAGNVLVVGGGSSGVQISDELRRAGKEVYLSVGAHDRPPRRYRGRDNVWWLGMLGLWDAPSMAPGKERFTICVSGARGGETVDFRRMAADGIKLVGMSSNYADGIMYFADDLRANIVAGDENYLHMLDMADAYVERTGINLPEDPEARTFLPDPACMTDPLRKLNLKEAGITAIVWATGFRQDFSWIKAEVFDDNGQPKHLRGVSDEPGLYFLGLPWQSRRASSFIWGVWHDAKFIADQIATRRNYLQYGSRSTETPQAAE